MKNKIFTGNSAQMMAISHYKGPAMVLAGPGSGKTFCITERIRYLIEEKSVVPSHILVITFTKAAAIEMQHRFMKNTDSSYPDVTFGTFHSVFYQIIRTSGHQNSQSLEIANEAFKQRIITNILFSLSANNAQLKCALETDTDISKDILSEISRIKNSALSCDMCDKSFSFYKSFPEIFKRYNRALSEFGKIDFDDMILMCHEILSSDSAVLDIWQKKSEFMLIDEYQDINMMQYRVIELLAGKDKNIFAVGDDDQSIYGFRGSDPQIMLDFEKHFLEADRKIYELDTNYRCGSEILNCALMVIDENKNRFKKNLKADISNGKGMLVPLKYTKKEIQYRAIAGFLEKQADNLKNIAILCRTNSECMSIAAVLKEHDIPTNIDDYTKSFLESEAVKTILNYLRFSCENKSREYFFKIMNKPLRYISREAVCGEMVSEMSIKRKYSGNPKMSDTVERLFSQINMIAHLRPKLSVRFIRNEVGIDKLYPKEKSLIDEFEAFAGEYEDTKALLKEADRRLEEIRENDKRPKKRSGDYVRLLTMHASKGLEFDVVWIPDLNEGVIPSRSAVTDAQTEEERRMLYVAMTRAKKALIMSYVTGTAENAVLPSRFLRPIKEKWEEKYNVQPSSPSSGSSTSSSNSTSSR